MRTPITYYGGKQQLASVILGMMPSHKVYCEPYLGGGAVFFAKGKSFCECINDIDDRIVTFYDVCRDIRKFQLLQQRIQNTLDIEREFLRADSKLKNAGLRYVRENYDEEDPIKSKVEVILFVQSEECMAELDKYAKDTFYQYKHNYRKYLSKYSENVKSKYDKYTREGEEVSEHSWILPNTIYLPKGEEQWEDRKHLFVDQEGKALFPLNNWEKEVIIEAEKDPDFVCWLRNQDRKPWALCIPYMMNEKVAELGLADVAHFTNPVGVYDDNHYCTPVAMAMIMKAALENDLCREALGAKRFTTAPTEQHPEGILISNWFLRRIEDKDTHGEVLGAKTGFVNQSRNCAVSYERSNDGHEYICVTGNAHSAWRAIYDHVAIYDDFVH